MKKETLIKIAEFIVQMVNELIPISSNDSKNLSLRRILWITIARSKNDSFGTRKEIKKNWKLCLEESEQETLSIFAAKKISGHFFGKRYQSISALDLVKLFKTSCEKRSSEQLHKNNIPYSRSELDEKIAKNAIQFGIGNCGEKAALALCLAREYNTGGYLLVDEKNNSYSLPPIEKEKIRAEKCYLDKQNGDHAFLILNRDPNSQLSDLSTWGKDTIIVDPWMDAVVDVNKELALSHEERSFCINYILRRAKHLSTEKNGSCHLGDGCTEHWKRKRAQKSQPSLFLEWQPVKITREQETIPWIIENRSENLKPAKKQRREY